MPDARTAAPADTTLDPLVAEFARAPAPAAPVALLLSGLAGSGITRLAFVMARGIEPRPALALPAYLHALSPGTAAGRAADTLERPTDPAMLAHVVAAAAKRRCNLVADTSPLAPRAQLDQARLLRQAGYRVTAVFVSSDLDTCRHAMTALYDRSRRLGLGATFLGKADEEQALARLREAIPLLEARQAVDQLDVVTRDGRSLYSNQLVDGAWRRAAGALHAFDDFRQRPPTARELAAGALRWQSLARLVADPAVPRAVAACINAWRSEALARAQRDPDARRLVAFGLEADAFRTLSRDRLLAEFPHLEKAVRKLDEARQFAQREYTLETDRERFVLQARERIAERVASGRFAAPRGRDVEPPTR